MKLRKNIMQCMCILFLITLSGCFGDNNIEMVKNGTLTIDESTTIAQAFEGNQFHQDSEWNSFEDAQGRIVVEYKARLNLPLYGSSMEESSGYIVRTIYATKLSKEEIAAIRNEYSTNIEKYFLMIQFILNASKESFNISYMGLYLDENEVTRAKGMEELEKIYMNQASFDGYVFERILQKSRESFSNNRS